MEYIQGNSVATMLARKEGFSIWDLLDITRQVCAALEYAATKGVAHHSLEPAKIMVQWDGMVKIIGYGISNMSLIGADSGKGLGRLMPYCSPDQIRGEATDSKKTTQAPSVAVNSIDRAAAASKFVSSGSSAAKPEAPVRSQTAPPAAGTKASAAAAGAVTGGGAAARVSNTSSNLNSNLN